MRFRIAYKVQWVSFKYELKVSKYQNNKCVFLFIVYTSVNFYHFYFIIQKNFVVFIIIFCSNSFGIIVAVIIHRILSKCDRKCSVSCSSLAPCSGGTMFSMRFDCGLCTGQEWFMHIVSITFSEMLFTSRGMILFFPLKALSLTLKILIHTILFHIKCFFWYF